jgi:hypothetical protein
MRLSVFVFLMLYAAPFTKAQSVLPPGLASMSPQQRKDSGIDSLSETQLRVLSSYIVDAVNRAYTGGLAMAGSGSGATATSSTRSSPASARPSAPLRQRTYITGGGHWIQENSGGKIITLEDGSLWQINPIDQVDTALWLPVTDIVVLPAENSIGGYDYILLSKDDGEKAHAKYLGRD